MPESGVSFHAVHRKDPEIMNRTQWHWGWLAVDRADGLAVGVITTTLDRDDDAVAVIQILYCRRYPLGSTLALHARLETDAMDATLYRSGEATEKGEKACIAAGLEIHQPARRVRRIGPPTRPFTPAVAESLGRGKLELAATYLGVGVIGPKE